MTSLATLTRVRSRLTNELCAYLRELTEAPDREYLPGTSERIKPSALYIDPDVLKWGPPPALLPRGRGEESPEDRQSPLRERFGPESLDVGEEVLNGERVREWERRVSWREERDKLRNSPERFAVILGAPGTGKTTLAAYAARALAQEALHLLKSRASGVDSVPLPVMVMLPRLMDVTPHIGESAKSALMRGIETNLAARGFPKLPCEFIVGRIREPSTWLFMDALDEVECDRKDRLQSCMEVLRCLHCRIIVTSRPYGWITWQGLFGSWFPVQYRLAPLTKDQINAFVNQWFQVPERRRVVQELIQRIPSLNSLARVPFLLRLQCAVLEKRDIAPDITRTRLYEQMLEIWLEGRASSWQRVLEELAWTGFLRHPREARLTVEELRPVLEDSAHRPKPQGIDTVEKLAELSKTERADLLIEELQRLRLLVPDSMGQAYLFPHRSMTEYFVGRALARHGETETMWKMIDKKAWSPDWEEPIRYMAGALRHDGEEKLLRILADERRDDAFKHRLALAAKCLPELSDYGGAIGREVAFRTISFWWQCVRKWKSGAVRHLAESLPSLTQCNLEHEGQQFREWVRSKLKQEQRSGALEPSEAVLHILTTHLRDKPDEMAALQTIREMGVAASQADLISDLLARLDRWGSERSREAALALASLGLPP